MKKTKKTLASLAIAGMVMTMVPFNVFANGTIPTRLAGVTAEQTAVKIADQTGWTGVAILASSASYGMVDALTSGPLATRLKAPILLQGPGASLNADTKTELVKLAVKKVYVTSGTAVISQGVLTELAGMGITVVALGGNDRFDTSVNIAKEMIKLGAPVSKVAVAYGWLNQDALSIASIASAAAEPIILTEKAGLSASAKAFLVANVAITASDVIGGTGVIDDTVLTQLPGANRHFGNTAYDTNSKVIQDFADALTFDNVFVANAVTGIDALAGAPLAAQTKSAIVLTDGVSSPKVAEFTYSKNASAVVTALGGEAVVPEAVRTKVAAGVVDGVVGELAITAVSALTDDGRVLAVDFNKAHAAVDKSQVKIYNTKSLERVGVEKVELSTDGMTLEVTLYDTENAEEILRAVEYTIEVGSLKFNFSRANYFDQDDNARITAVNATDKEITLEAKDADGSALKEVLTVPVTSNLNFEEVLGQTVRIWYDANSVVTKLEIQSVSYYEAIEVNLADKEITVEATDKVLDLADEYTTFLNDSEEDLTTDEYDYAKVILNKNGDVAYIYAYNWDEYMVVEEVNDYVAMSYDNSELDLEDYIIVKDGLQIATSDLEAGDILYINSNAKDGDGFAVVYNNSVTGEIEDVFSAEIRIDGKTYNYAGMKYDKATQYLDGDSFEAVDSDVAEEFQAGGDVTLFLDHKGDAVYLTGAQEVVDSNNLGFHLTEDVVYYNASGAAGRGTLELEGVNGDGDEKVYTFRVDTLDTITSSLGEFEVGEAFSTSISTEIDKFAISALSGAVINALDEVGNVIGPVTTGLDALTQDNDFIEIETDDEGIITGLSFLTEKTFSETTDALELDDKFVDGYKLMANTVVFDGSAGWDTTYKPDADDINVSTWGDLADEGFKVFEASYYINDDNEVDYLVIKNSDAEDTTDYNAVVTKVLKNTDSEITELNVLLDGHEKTYDVDEVKNSAVVKGSIVTLAVNDGDATMVEDIDVVTKQGVVSAVSVSERTVTVTGANAGVYTLVSDGSVINSKDTGDILVKALRDIRIGDTVNLSLDEEVPSTSHFVDVVNIVSSTATAPVVATGIVSYINSTSTAFAVDGKSGYTITADTILKDKDGVVIEMGLDAGTGTNCVIEGDQVKVEGNVITILATKAELATAAEQKVVDAELTKVKSAYSVPFSSTADAAAAETLVQTDVDTAKVSVAVVLAGGIYTVTLTSIADSAVTAEKVITLSVAAVSTDAKLKAITVNGLALTGFNASTLTYNVELSNGTTVVPTVVGTVNAAVANAVVTPTVTVIGATTIVVTAQDGSTTATYTINFTVAAL